MLNKKEVTEIRGLQCNYFTLLLWLLPRKNGHFPSHVTVTCDTTGPFWMGTQKTQRGLRTVYKVYTVCFVYSGLIAWSATPNIGLQTDLDNFVLFQIYNPTKKYLDF